jgi:UDP-glucose 4-epimerase
VPDDHAEQPTDADDDVSEWAVVGATGFVGRNFVAELRRAGRSVREVTAPRLAADVASNTDDLISLLSYIAQKRAIAGLAESFRGIRVVVNAAGLATPGAPPSKELTGANALLPGVLALAAAAAGVGRVVHISSAAVQDRADPLDESRAVSPATPYARSKAAGEAVLQRIRQSPEINGSKLSIVVLRATSVHGPDRQTTARLMRLARSPWASVAGDGARPAPIVSVQELAAAVRFVGEYPGDVPEVVLQPWEGRTTAGVLRELGGREPRHIPLAICRLMLSLAYLSSRLLGGRGRSSVRRLEVLWTGQSQRPGWLEATGFRVRSDQRSVIGAD